MYWIIDLDIILTMNDDILLNNLIAKIQYEKMETFPNIALEWCRHLVISGTKCGYIADLNCLTHAS